MSTARIALDVFTEIVCDEAYANLALKTALGKITDERDKRFVSALVYTALEHLSYIDFVIASFAKGRQNKTIKNIVRLGACQIMFMNRKNSAVCNECVKLARETGKSALSGYVNGVLRNICRAAETNNMPPLPDDEVKRMAVETGYPSWLVSEYIERFGKIRAHRILTSKDEGLSIRAQYPYTDKELEGFLNDKDIKYFRGKLDGNVFRICGASQIGQSELFTSGKITFQSESSAVVCRACGITENMKILDACAAPGGKSAYLASLVQKHCEITACELHEHRKALMDNTFERLNVDCVHTNVCDMTKPHTDFYEAFDLALCDVPCSGLGVLGKPDTRYRRDAQSIDEIVKIQAAIINNCAAYVKKGGMLVYSTCTVSMKENENIINAFLAEHRDYEPDGRLAECLPEYLHERIDKGMLHLLPDIDGTDGFFIAKLRRKES